jgi:hypothetical protein
VGGKPLTLQIVKRHNKIFLFTHTAELSKIFRSKEIDNSTYSMEVILIINSLHKIHENCNLSPESDADFSVQVIARNCVWLWILC